MNEVVPLWIHFYLLQISLTLYRPSPLWNLWNSLYTGLQKHVHVHFFLISTAFQFSLLLIKKYCTICTQMKFMYALKYIWIIQPACLVHEIQVGWSFLTRHISDIRVSCNFSVLWTSWIRVDDSRDHRLFNEVKFNVI